MGAGTISESEFEPFQRLAAPFPSRLGGANRMGPIPAGRAALEARRHIFTFFICKYIQTIIRAPPSERN